MIKNYLPKIYWLLRAIDRMHQQVLCLSWAVQPVKCADPLIMHNTYTVYSKPSHLRTNGGEHWSVEPKVR